MTSNSMFFFFYLVWKYDSLEKKPDCVSIYANAVKQDLSVHLREFAKMPAPKISIWPSYLNLFAVCKWQKRARLLTWHPQSQVVRIKKK